MTSSSPKPAAGFPDGLVLYDGVCVFCSRWVRAVIARDAAKTFRFASVQSPYGRAMADAFGIDPEAPETNATVLDGRAWLKSDSALAILSRLPGFSWTRSLRLIPKPARDFVYDRVARNRYRLFGRTETCFVPAPADRDRFIDDDPPPAAYRQISSLPMSK